VENANKVVKGIPPYPPRSISAVPCPARDANCPTRPKIPHATAHPPADSSQAKWWRAVHHTPSVGSRRPCPARDALSRPARHQPSPPPQKYSIPPIPHNNQAANRHSAVGHPRPLPHPRLPTILCGLPRSPAPQIHPLPPSTPPTGLAHIANNHNKRRQKTTKDSLLFGFPSGTLLLKPVGI